MVHCVAAFCFNTSNKSKGISFHSFPKDKKLRRAWEIAVGRKSLPKNPKLCSDHFEVTDYENSSRIKKSLGFVTTSVLKKGAIPSKFVHEESKKPSRCKQRENRAAKKARQEVLDPNLLTVFKVSGPKCNVMSYSVGEAEISNANKLLENLKDCYHIVKKQCLLDLFRRCQNCGEIIKPDQVKIAVVGAKVLIAWECLSGHNGIWSGVHPVADINPEISAAMVKCFKDNVNAETNDVLIQTIKEEIK